MADIALAVIGGTGVYRLADLQYVETRVLDTRFGAPFSRTYTLPREALPAPSRNGQGQPSALALTLQALRANTGQWAEIASYPRSKRQAAQSRGFQTCRRHDDIEYAIRTVGDEVILFMRAVAA